MAEVNTSVFWRFSHNELATIARLRSEGASAKEIARAIGRRDDHIERVTAFMEAPRTVGRPPKNDYGTGEHEQAVLTDVAAEYCVSVAEILGQSRVQQVSYARQAAMWRLRHDLGLSFPTIARILHRGDHTTVLYGVRAHEARLLEASGRSYAA